MRHALALIFAFGLGFISQQASAWTPIEGSRPVWGTAAPYSLNQNGSSDMGYAATLAEVERGMEDWTRVSCGTSLRTTFRGATTSTPGNYDGVSTVGWIESGWRHGSGALGVTGPRWTVSRAGSEITEADMEMNGVHYSWTAGSGGRATNAYSIVLHEAGHYYGLGHTTVRGSSMWPSYSGGIISLGSDDEAGICALYPGSGMTDCTTTGCPSGQECIEGVCQEVRGDGSICSPCSDSSQCGGSSDYCIGYPDGAGYCGRSCGSDADCDDASCESLSGGVRQCVRYDGFTPSCAGGSSTSPDPECNVDTDCPAGERCSSGMCEPVPSTASGLGEACTGDDDCQSGLCMGGFCSQSCDWLSPTSCPAGFYCDWDIAPSCDSGYCLAGTAGTATFGQACSLDTDCQSLFCVNGSCSEPCVPTSSDVSATGCPAGSACAVDTLACRGSCQMAGALGDPCETNSDCLSGICAVTGDRTFCTDICGEGTPCPDRFTCTPVGDTAVCVPDAGSLGDPCDSSTDCLSDLCTNDNLCTRFCDTSNPCPADHECVDVSGGAGTQICVPLDGGSDGCGCTTIGVDSNRGGVWSLLLLGLLFVRRRRR